MNQNEQDTKPERTALRIDISRRKRLLDKLYKEYKGLTNKRDEAKTKTQKDREIFLGQYCLDLFKDIQNSEKLMKVERGQWEDAYLTGWNDSYVAHYEGFEVPTEKQRFDEKYGTNEKYTNNGK